MEKVFMTKRLKELTEECNSGTRPVTAKFKYQISQNQPLSLSYQKLLEAMLTDMSQPVGCLVRVKRGESLWSSILELPAAETVLV